MSVINTIRLFVAAHQEGMRERGMVPTVKPVYDSRNDTHHEAHDEKRHQHYLDILS